MTMHSGLLGPTGMPIRLDSGGSQRQLWNQVRRPTNRLIGDQRNAESSSTAALDSQPFIWDSNGFYRRLGLEPGASRVEVARAYQTLDGHRSAALTNAAEVLINKYTKRQYDRLPLGVLWADDVLLPPHADLEGEFEAANPGDAEWAYYLIGVEDEELPDGHEEILAVWRCMLAASLWTSGAHRVVRTFAVGLGHEMSVGWIGFRLVAIFPLTLKPSSEYAPALARLMVESVRERNSATPPMYGRSSF